MIRYFDTGMNGPGDSLGRWLDGTLVPGVRAFRGQFGFFDGAALRPFLPVLQGVVTDGGVVRIVIGANVGDPPTTDDLAAMLPLLGPADRTSLTVVALSGALFHPKTMHLVRGDGRHVGVVSSANFTRRGLGHSVEAGIVLETAAGTDATLAQVAAAIDRWATAADPGVYQIRTQEDIDRLLSVGLAVTSAARRAIRSRQRTGTPATGRGTRPVGWRPPPAAGAAPEDEAEETAEVEEAAPVGGAPVAAPVAPAAPVHRWAKVLKRSDAQQVPAGTNPTGKLRLGQAHFPIEQETWFRDVLFADQNWVQSVRRGVAYEEVHVPFRVSRHGGPWVPMTLKIDHAAHRVADQNNVPTVLSWGRELGEWLRNNDQVGEWVAIEKDVNGNYWMTIQNAKPAWAP